MHLVVQRCAEGEDDAVALGQRLLEHGLCAEHARQPQRLGHWPEPARAPPVTCDRLRAAPTTASAASSAATSAADPTAVKTAAAPCADACVGSTAAAATAAAAGLGEAARQDLSQGVEPRPLVAREEIECVGGGDGAAVQQLRRPEGGHAHADPHHAAVGGEAAHERCGPLCCRPHLGQEVCLREYEEWLHR